MSDPLSRATFVQLRVWLKRAVESAVLDRLIPAARSRRKVIIGGFLRAHARRRLATKEPFLKWLRRWRLVNKQEREELRHTSIEVKLRQLAALMASASELGWDEERASEELCARERWQRLRRAYMAERDSAPLP